METKDRVAILIDAENVAPVHADTVFRHARELGELVASEIYGSATALTVWAGPILRYVIRTNLTVRAVKGKNTSDIALTIGAMDLLARGGADCLVVVSSDSDFSQLAYRLRQSGVRVVGMGSVGAPELWHCACTEYVALDEETPAPAAAEPPKPVAKEPKPKKAPEQDPAQRRQAILEFAMRELKSRGGSMPVPQLCSMVGELKEFRAEPTKRPRKYIEREFAEQFVFRGDTVWLPECVPNEEPAAEEEKPVTAEEVPAAAEEKIPEAAGEETPVTAEETLPTAEEEAPVIEEENPVTGEETSAATGEEIPAAEEETSAEIGEETPAAKEAASEAEQLDPIVQAILSAGADAETANRAAAIAAEKGRPRAVYNELRHAFGRETGTAYYHLIKELL